jgi:hypothetical protein
MKRTILLLLLASVSIAFGRIRTVDYAGGAEHQTIHGAVTAASAGDTIVVFSGQYPFTSALGKITVSKKLIIIGSGYDLVANGGCELYDLTTTGFFLFEGNADGSKIKGFRFKTSGTAITVNNDVRNMVIEKNLFVNTGGSGHQTWTVNISASQNDTIRHNIFTTSQASGYNGRGLTISTCSNMIVNNNIFAGLTGGLSASMSSSKIYNNFFTHCGADIAWGNTSTALYIANNPDVYSNAFYVSGSGQAFSDGTGGGNVNNNGFYETGQTAGLEFIDADPLYVGFTTSDYINETAVDDQNYDITLGSGSPYINAGVNMPEYYDTDGTRNDIGLFGGPKPYNETLGIPTIPLVRTISVTPGMVEPGGSLQLQATGRIGESSAKTAEKNSTSASQNRSISR